MKRKYNPFKMWGSWIGAVAGWFILPYILPATGKFIKIGTSSYDYIFILSIPIGFIIGYFIEKRLFKRRRK